MPSVSSFNPFRTPAATPTPTGSSAPDRSRRDSPPSPPRSNNISVNDILSEDLPPAYTPAPNVYEGETTVELGPRRPFQQAPPPRIPQQQQQQQFPPAHWQTPQHTNSSWSGFPGQVHRNGPNAQLPPPPPQHPTRQDTLRPSSTPPTASDFARDFYAAGSDADPTLFGGPSSQYAGEPASPPRSPRYAPPPGQPPQRAASSATPRSARSEVPDDGRPTERPVPGHPLIRNGKVLMYPEGHKCQKCRNTGYKNFDPSHPCERCWEKYSKAYAGAIAHSPWSSSDESSRFQRPLPKFAPPQESMHRQHASYPSTPASAGNLGRAATTSRVNGGGYPGAVVAPRVIPIAGGMLPVAPRLDSLLTGINSRIGARLPGGAPFLQPPPAPGGPQRTVYRPGDPRLGGRLCWRCSGSGTTSFLIFDEGPCGICKGIGRTFV